VLGKWKGEFSSSMAGGEGVSGDRDTEKKLPFSGRKIKKKKKKKKTQTDKEKIEKGERKVSEAKWQGLGRSPFGMIVEVF